VQVLILDEVSMLHAEFIDWLDSNVRDIKSQADDSLGGIQLIVTGDFCQLPPVPGKLDLDKESPPSEDAAEREKLIPTGIKQCENLFAFQSHFWEDANFRVIQLKRVYRQVQ
jgi:ATP-dependent DNA helicase PIF1